MEPITLIVGGATAAIIGGEILVDWIGSRLGRGPKRRRTHTKGTTRARKATPTPRPAPNQDLSTMYHGTDSLEAAYNIFYENTWEFIGKNTPSENPTGIWLTPNLKYARTMAKEDGAIILLSISPRLIPDLIKESDDRYVREIPGADPDKPHIIEGLTPISVLDVDGRPVLERWTH